MSPECSLEGLMLKLKLQYFGHLMQSTDSFEKTLMLGLKAGGEGDDRRWDGWMASLTQWIWVWVSSGSWWWTGRPGVLQSIGSQIGGHNWVTELNWTDTVYGVTKRLDRTEWLSLSLLIIRVLMSEKSTSYCIWYWYHNNNRNGVSKLLQNKLK